MIQNIFMQTDSDFVQVKFLLCVMIITLSLKRDIYVSP